MISFSQKNLLLLTLYCLTINFAYSNNKSISTTFESSLKTPIVSDIDIYKNGNEWEFLGKTFYDEFLKKYNPKAPNYTALVALLSAGFVGIHVAGLITLAGAASEDPEAPVLGFISFIPTALLTFLLVMAIGYENPKEKASKRNIFVLEKFLNSWNTYKEITPQSLHELFDKLSTAYKEKPQETLEEYAHISEEIHQLVISNSSKFKLLQSDALAKERIKKINRWQ